MMGAMGFPHCVVCSKGKWGYDNSIISAALNDVGHRTPQTQKGCDIASQFRYNPFHCSFGMPVSACKYRSQIQELERNVESLINTYIALAEDGDTEASRRLLDAYIHVDASGGSRLKNSCRGLFEN